MVDIGKLGSKKNENTVEYMPSQKVNVSPGSPAAHSASSEDVAARDVPAMKTHPGTKSFDNSNSSSNHGRAHGSGDPTHEERFVSGDDGSHFSPGRIVAATDVCNILISRGAGVPSDLRTPASISSLSSA